MKIERHVVEQVLSTEASASSGSEPLPVGGGVRVVGVLDDLDAADTLHQRRRSLAFS